MKTPWIKDHQLQTALQRNEAFWTGDLEDYPLMWITVPDALPGIPPDEPPTDDELWTDVDYVIKVAEYQLSHTHYAGDALPVHHPWLGPDQVAAWLGAEMFLKPRQFTSWVNPCVSKWTENSQLKIDPDNRWWQLYLEIVRASVQAGKDKWITAYPDLHTGLDGLSALRGPENISMDLITDSDIVHSLMKQMTQLWKDIVDTVSDLVLPTGQGCSNWTMGWSEKRFLCIGQNDYTCMISPQMYKEFCVYDNRHCCEHADYSLYHLDGPDAIRHLPRILEIENLTAVQWIQGAGNPYPSQWLDMLSQIQAADKGIQVMYYPSHGGDADLFEEISILCENLDPTKLFFCIQRDSVKEAEALLEHARRVCRKSVV